MGRIVFFPSVNIKAQVPSEKYTISGTVKDSETGELLVGVAIVLKGNEPVGTATGLSGDYMLKAPSGKHILTVSYIGYENKIIEISIKKDITQDFSLNPSVTGLHEVVITARKADENVTEVQSGVEKISMKEANKLPALLGEKDIIKSIQLLPGVRSTGEGSSGIYVRGGSSDQNSILLDNIPLYNTSHLMGFFSTFNSDAIKNATLYKGTMPAQYGGKLASVIDIQMKDGDLD